MKAEHNAIWHVQQGRDMRTIPVVMTYWGHFRVVAPVRDVRAIRAAYIGTDGRPVGREDNVVGCGIGGWVKLRRDNREVVFDMLRIERVDVSTDTVTLVGTNHDTGHPVA